MSAQRSDAKLLVVIPCLDEEPHLARLVTALLSDPAAASARVVVVDGGSRDRSVAIAQELATRDPRVAVLDNPKRLQSAGINLAVRRFGAECVYLIRVDAHAAYPSDYLAQLVAAAEQAAADSVTVSMRAIAHAGRCFQTAAAAAQNSVLGAGGSPHRSAGARRWVDHGHHALFRMAAFQAAGGYDESFSHNEDAELDARLVATGARILLAADIVIDYYPRASAGRLARQYFQFGRGRARMLARHRRIPKLRQLAPLLVAPAAVLAAAAPLWPPAALPAAVWLTLCLAYGAALGIKERRACALAAGAPAAIMHLAWSAGFWLQLAILAIGRRAARGGVRNPS